MKENHIPKQSGEQSLRGTLRKGGDLDTRFERDETPIAHELGWVFFY